MKYLLLISLLITLPVLGQKDKNDDDGLLSKSTVSGLKFRLVGPASTSGRIADIAVHPDNHNIWYVAAASGGVWKTTNHGTTFKPIFDSYGSYSTGCVTMAPTNPNVIWVGTGENNNQRSVAYGDGVYKSVDGGKSFKNMGLKDSEHIGKIIVHPYHENIVWVAAYGPLWSAGGDRGVYKSTDGGETWKKTLDISEHTGIAEIAIDPSDPNILYASAHQRRRRQWTYLGGGPESGLYKSTDGGETWKEINSGLPKGEMGRIGIAVSPANPDYVYAIVEAREDKAGFFRSTNKGETWSKMSSYKTSGNYYQEIICDLTDEDKVFSMNTWLHHTDDGGKNFKPTGEKNKHVDNHCIWIDPNDSDHWIVGCDGGIYETWNHAKEWRYYDNLPIIQFYKVATDNDKPFYNIYGGTQDNNSMGGPSATTNNAGILNSDWYITNGGDGFESAIDPTNPDIAYAQAQYGGLVRFDRASGEKTPIKPLPGKDGEGYRWNWDSPLLISPHDHKTLYFCSNKVLKSTNRGDDWEEVSPDLSRQLDRNKLPVMGQVWSIEAVMKNMSTSIYGSIVAFDESPIKKGLLYTGTDDGLIQVSENDGASWQKYSSFDGIPDMTRAHMIIASLHNENTVFAVFNNHKSGDFKPYIMKSTDKGKSWKSISGDLPERGSVYSIRQDHVDPNLLFAGTEFGCYFSNNGGKNWIKLAGLPTIAVYDIDIQKRENDLVVATFGRGFYVLDNYSPLRNVSEENLNKEVYLFPVKPALQFVESSPLGYRGNSSKGANLWQAENPEYGAVFTLYLKGTESSMKSKRNKAEKKKEEAKEPAYYPSFEDLWAEENEDKAKLIWIIREASGTEVYRMTSSPKKGISRTSWNLRKTSTSPVRMRKSDPGRYGAPDYGLMVTPGEYTVEIFYEKDGEIKPLVEKTSFEVKGLNNQTLLASNNEELAKGRADIAEIKRQVDGAGRLLNENGDRLKLIDYTIRNYPNADINWLKQTDAMRTQFNELRKELWGDWIKSKYQFESEPSISNRVGTVYWQLFSNTTSVTKTQKENMEIVREEYTDFRARLDKLISELDSLEEALEQKGVPYFEGQDVNWKEE